MAERPLLLRNLTGVAVVLAAVVVVLGAYTRLVDAGLGCPDWPGCYGFLTVPEAAHEIAAAEERFPHAPLQAHLAWPEMVHRYFAAALGALIAAIALIAWRSRGPSTPVRLPIALLLLVMLQGAFGAWTVTLKLWPQVVTAHLLGGFATLSLLWLLWLRLRGPAPAIHGVRGLAVVALAVVIMQVALGGWTTSNYAALACPDFPTCQNVWWPEMDTTRGFNVLQHVGPNYLGGLLDGDARIAIHMAHRLGAVAVLMVVGLLAFRLRRAAPVMAIVLATMLVIQVCLGIANVVFSLPLAVATAHNAGGAALLLTLVQVNYRSLYAYARARAERGNSGTQTCARGTSAGARDTTGKSQDER